MDRKEWVEKKGGEHRRQLARHTERDYGGGEKWDVERENQFSLSCQRRMEEKKEHTRWGGGKTLNKRDNETC